MEEQLGEILYVAKMILSDGPNYSVAQRRDVGKRVRAAWTALQPPPWTKAELATQILRALDRAGRNLDGMLSDNDKDNARTALDARDVTAREIGSIFAHPFSPRERFREPDPNLLLACVEAWRPSRARGRGRPEPGAPNRNKLTVDLLGQIGVSDARNKNDAVRQAVKRHVGARRVLSAKEKAATEAAQIAQIAAAIRQVEAERARLDKADRRK